MNVHAFIIVNLLGLCSLGWFLCKRDSDGVQPKDTGLVIQTGGLTGDCENIHFLFPKLRSSPEKKGRAHNPCPASCHRLMYRLHENGQEGLQSEKCYINVRDSSYFVGEALSSFSKAC